MVHYLFFPQWINPLRGNFAARHTKQKSELCIFSMFSKWYTRTCASYLCLFSDTLKCSNPIGRANNVLSVWVHFN